MSPLSFSLSTHSFHFRPSVWTRCKECPVYAESSICARRWVGPSKQTNKQTYSKKTHTITQEPQKREFGDWFCGTACLNCIQFKINQLTLYFGLDKLMKCWLTLLHRQQDLHERWWCMYANNSIYILHAKKKSPHGLNMDRSKMVVENID